MPISGATTQTTNNGLSVTTEQIPFYKPSSNLMPPAPGQQPDGYNTLATFSGLPDGNTAKAVISPDHRVLQSQMFGPDGKQIGMSTFDEDTGVIQTLSHRKPDGSVEVSVLKDGKLTPSET
jgi:hypothetical protein